MITTERVRGFQPPWRTIYVVRCDGCGATLQRISKNWHGSVPPGVLPLHPIYCECAQEA